LFPTGSHTRALIERELRSRGARVEVVAESHQPEVLREMARLGVGWTVLPDVQAGMAKGGRKAQPKARQDASPRVSAAQSPMVLARRRLVVARLRARSPHGAADRFVALLEG
jgi:DNA-binding transcriptional LysR family regulator